MLTVLGCLRPVLLLFAVPGVAVAFPRLLLPVWCEFSLVL